MKAQLIYLDGTREEFKPEPGVFAVAVKVPCACGSSMVAGQGAFRKDRDTYESAAFCTVCKADRGRFEVQIETIFGIEEDEAVLCGRARVY